MDTKKIISYVFPIYNEEEIIDILYEKIIKVVGKLDPRYKIEIIFVNDGSSDSSLSKLISLHKIDNRISIISFSRNFGHQMAITAGLDYANGDAVIILDADLQDPPEVSLELIKKWEEGFEVVYAQRRNRKDTLFKRSTAFLFYRMLSNLTEISIPRDTGDFRLIDKKVVKAIREFRERNRFMRGLFAYIGFKQTAVLFDRSERYAGKTKYPLKKMIKLAIDGITSFSTKPLRIIIQVGLWVSFLSFLGILYAVILRIFFPNITVSGWTITIISIYFIGGVQMIMLGILGTYIAQIYTEIQNRPLYIVSSVFSHNGKSN